MSNMLANIFGSSPVFPIEKHMGVAYECAKQLRGFFAAVVADDWDEASRIRARIVELEHEADSI